MVLTGNKIIFYFVCNIISIFLVSQQTTNSLKMVSIGMGSACLPNARLFSSFFVGIYDAKKGPIVGENWVISLIHTVLPNNITEKDG